MTDPIVIRLSEAEMLTAAIVGARRQAENLAKGRLDAHGARKANGWQLHIEGACGEMAFAKYADRYWTGNLGDLDADDVGRWQVRTRSEHSFDLILHRTDPDDRAFVLVTGTAPVYVIRGWIMGRDGKREEYWSDPARNRPAFFVPQAALHPMEASP
jgi:hypothetical protein